MKAPCAFFVLPISCASTAFLSFHGPRRRTLVHWGAHNPRTSCLWQAQTHAMLCPLGLHILLGLQDSAVLPVSLAVGYPQAANRNGRTWRWYLRGISSDTVSTAMSLSWGKATYFDINIHVKTTACCALTTGLSDAASSRSQKERKILQLAASFPVILMKWLALLRMFVFLFWDPKRTSTSWCEVTVHWYLWI